MPGTSGGRGVKFSPAHSGASAVSARDRKLQSQAGINASISTLRSNPCSLLGRNHPVGRGFPCFDYLLLEQSLDSQFVHHFVGVVWSRMANRALDLSREKVLTA